MNNQRMFRGKLTPRGGPSDGLEKLSDACGKREFLASINPMIEDAAQFTLRGSKAVKLAEKLQREGKTWRNGIEHGLLRFDIGNTSSNPEIVTPDVIRDSVARMVRTEPIPYTSSSGTQPLKKALSEAYGIPCNEIYVVNGVTEALGVTALFFSNTMGDVVVTAPVYPPWVGILLLHGVDVRKVMREPSGKPDVKTIESNLGPASNGTVIITAGNPDGLFMDLESAEGMAMALHKNMVANSRLQFLVVDDIYLEQIPKERRIDYFAISERYGIPLLYMGGVDKTIGTGFHGGYLILHVPEVLNGIREQICGKMDEIFAMYLGANTLTQEAMHTYLREYEMLTPEILANFEKYSEWTAKFSAGLKRTNGVRYYYREPDFGLYHLLRLPRGIDSDDFAAALVERHGICVSPGKSFGVIDGIRIAMIRDPIVPVEIAPIISRLAREF